MLIITALYLGLLVLSIFRRGWLFSAGLFCFTIGMLWYIEATVEMTGKAWVVAGLGLICLLNLVQTMSNFGRFKVGRD